MGADILCHMVLVSQSCPDLQNVTLDFRPEYGLAAEDLDMQQAAADLEALSGIRRLQGLQLKADQLPAPLWKALGTLTQLTSLALSLAMPKMDNGFSSNVKYLNGCTSLHSLMITVNSFCHPLRLAIESQVRASSQTAWHCGCPAGCLWPWVLCFLHWRMSKYGASVLLVVVACQAVLQPACGTLQGQS